MPLGEAGQDYIMKPVVPALTWWFLILSVPGGRQLSGEVVYQDSLYERRAPEHCRLNLPESLLASRVTIIQCGVECETRRCWRFLYCRHTKTCAINTNSFNTTGCDCLVAKKTCQNGGHLDVNEDCQCLNGYHGSECEHVIKDCNEAKTLGLGTGDQIAWIKPVPSSPAFQVMCNFEYGFTYIHRRQNWACAAGPNFNRTWDDYVNGFGELPCKFWLGLEKIHLLTLTGTHSLEVNVDVYDDWGQGFYCPFSVGGADTNYRVSLNNYTTFDNPLTDSFHGPHGQNIDGKPFSTFDHDTMGTGCPQRLGGGFWYDTNCTQGGLNGPFVPNDNKNLGLPRMFWGGEFANKLVQHALLRVQRVDEC